VIFHNFIQGTAYKDSRGGLNFFNTFDMSEINRMYEISPDDTKTVRGWQGHKTEKKWFYCNAGSFIVNLIEIDDFDNPSSNLVPTRFVLDAKDPGVLEISGGYATGFKALRENSKLLVFSNFSLENSKQDDFRYEVDQWSAKW